MAIHVVAHRACWAGFCTVHGRPQWRSGERTRASIGRHAPHITCARPQPGSSPCRSRWSSASHHLGREEALRRIKFRLATVRTSYSTLLTIHEETWSGDRLAFA